MSSPMSRMASVGRKDNANGQQAQNFASFFGPTRIDPRLFTSVTASLLRDFSLTTETTTAAQHDASRRQGAPVSQLLTPCAPSTSATTGSDQLRTSTSLSDLAPDTDLLLSTGRRSARERVPVNYAEEDTEFDLDVDEADGTVSNVPKRKRGVSTDSTLTTSSQAAQKKAKTPTISSGPPMPRKVRADLDSDDELMMRLHEEGMSSKQISVIFREQGRTNYKDKSIASRIRRVQKVLHKSLEERANQSGQKFDDDDIKALVKAVVDADNYLDKEMEKLFAKKWRLVVDQVRRAAPGKDFSEAGCENAYIQWEKAQRRATRKVRDRPPKPKATTINDSLPSPGDGEENGGAKHGIWEENESEHDDDAENSDIEEFDETSRALHRRAAKKLETENDNLKNQESKLKEADEETIKKASVLLSAAMSSWNTKLASKDSGITNGKKTSAVVTYNGANILVPVGNDGVPVMPGTDTHATRQTLDANNMASSPTLAQKSTSNDQTSPGSKNLSETVAPEENDEKETSYDYLFLDDDDQDVSDGGVVVGDEDKQGSFDCGLFVHDSDYSWYSDDTEDDPNMIEQSTPALKFSSAATDEHGMLVPPAGRDVPIVPQTGTAAAGNGGTSNATIPKLTEAGFQKVQPSVGISSVGQASNGNLAVRPTTNAANGNQQFQSADPVADDTPSKGSFTARSSAISASKPNSATTPSGPTVNVSHVSAFGRPVTETTTEGYTTARVRYSLKNYIVQNENKASTAPSNGNATQVASTSTPAATPILGLANAHGFTPINPLPAAASGGMAQGSGNATTPSSRPVLGGFQGDSAPSARMLRSTNLTTNVAPKVSPINSGMTGSTSTEVAIQPRSTSPPRDPSLPKPALDPRCADLTPEDTRHKDNIPAPSCDSIQDYTKKLPIVNVGGRHVLEPCASGRRVVLANVPPFASPPDIRMLFSEFNFAGFTRDGCRGNNWFVDCDDQNAATRASVMLTGRPFSTFYHEVFPAWKLHCAIYRHPYMLFHHKFRPDYPVVPLAKSPYLEQKPPS